MEAQNAMRKHSRSEGFVRAVGMALAFYAQKGTRMAWPSNQELIEHTGYKERRVQRALRVLEAELGEIRRLPERESHRRRRLYLVCPEQGVQLSLLDAAGGENRPAASTTQGVNTTGVTRTGVSEGPTGVLHARAGKEPTEPALNGTPPAPQGGSADKQKGSSRRRRRRRGPEPCPLQSMAAGEVAVLQDGARELEDALRSTVGEDSKAWERWMAWREGAHLHRCDDEQIVLALPREGAASWIQGRLGGALSEAVGCPVIVVPCASVPAAKQRSVA